MKIVTVLGARPQFIKAAALSRLIQESNLVSEVIVHTGQHYDAGMSDIFFQEMSIPKPHYNLNINSLSHGAMTGRMIEALEEIFLKELPDVVVVYGDTNSTLAGALAASKLGIKIAHVEAGLRSFNMSMPEEINRILTDRVSSLLFCPTITAIKNLESEGFKNFPSKIVKTGDIMLDSALYYKSVAAQKAKIFSTPPKKPYILATIHRQENTDVSECLEGIFQALEAIDKTCSIILPLHPRTKKKIEDHKLGHKLNIIEPVGYFDMIQLITHAELIMTDSGGLQKEAYFFQKPCVTLRNETEWVELIECGANVLAGSDASKIIEAYKTMSQKKIDYHAAIYGDGQAAKTILSEIINLKHVP